MALEEITFTNTNGEEINLSNLVNQMINYYNLKLEVGETKITDFNEGSEIRNLLEAFAICIYALLEEQKEATRMAFISTSEGIFLDKIGELPFIDLERIQGEYATGTVTFTLAEVQTEDFVIPSETIVACSETGLDFVTTDECVIGIGELSVEAPVECLTMGADGNVSAGSIDTITDEDLNTELLTVTNESALENGAEEEYDDDYRERLLSNIRADGFGTQGWYVNLCTAVEGVHDVLLIDDANYTKKVLVNTTVKPPSNSILLAILTTLTDLDNKVLNHTFTVDATTYTTVNLTITLNVVNTILEADLQSQIQCLFDGGNSNAFVTFDGLNINEEITKDRITNAFETFEDVVEVTSVKQGSTEVTTITPSSNGALKLGTVTFVQNEV